MAVKAERTGQKETPTRKSSQQARKRMPREIVWLGSNDLTASDVPNDKLTDDEERDNGVRSKPTA
jgi:hypothetical protein